MVKIYAARTQQTMRTLKLVIFAIAAQVYGTGHVKVGASAMGTAPCIEARSRTAQTISVGDGVALAYLDSGIPHSSRTYTTIFALHAEIFFSRTYH